MRERTLWSAIRTLAILLGIAYLLAGIIGGFAIDFDSSADRTFWVVFLIAGGILLFAGLAVAARSRWLAVIVLAAGGILGSLIIFWAILPALATIALIVLTVLWARRPAAAA